MRAAGARLLRFGAAGLLNNILVVGLYWLLLPGLGVTPAYTVAFAVGVLISYLLNSLFVFGSRPTRRTALRFPVIYGVQYLGAVALLRLLVDAAGMDPRFAVIVVVLVSAGLTFLVLGRLFRNDVPSG